MKMAAETKGNLARIALMLVVYLVFAIQIPIYSSAIGVAALIDSAVLAGIIAIGVGLTMIAGEMDLSVGSMAALAGVLSIKFFAFGMIPAAAISATMSRARHCGGMMTTSGGCVSSQSRARIAWPVPGT